MRIKHFAGYGTVNAKKLYKKTLPNGDTVMAIEVTGNHEWGLLRNDAYDLKRWLVDRFDKDAGDFSPYRMDFSWHFEDRVINGLDTDCITYTFRY